MTRFFAFGLVLILICTAGAVADVPPMPDANDSIFAATQVVIVSHQKDQKPHTFTVVKSYEGNLSVGSSIELPAFRLVTWNGMGDEHPEPITDATRILLFLEPDPKNPQALVVSYYGYAFFFRDVAKIDELDAIVQHAIAVRQKWRAARDLPDRQERIRALFTYLLHSTYSCGRLTLDELVKLNPDSGDYLASILPTSSSDDCSSLLANIRYLQTSKSHAAAIAVINAARARFSKFLESHHLKSLDVKGHWNEVPDDVKDADGMIYYGLSAINSFRDKSDVAYMRDMVPFLLANDFNQPIEECVDGMKNCPEAANIPVLKAIWDEYKSHHYPRENESLLPDYLADAAAAQHDARAVGIEMDILDHNQMGHDSAFEALRDLTHQDFQTDAEWKSWYASQHPPVEKQTP